MNRRKLKLIRNLREIQLSFPNHPLCRIDFHFGKQSHNAGISDFPENLLHVGASHEIISTNPLHAKFFIDMAFQIFHKTIIAFTLP